MSDSRITQTAPLGESDEPRSWWRRAWRFARARWPRHSKTAALREAVEELIEESTAESGVPTAEQMLLTNILKLRERHVGDCMVPRADIVAVDVDSDMKQLVDVMTEHAHSRIPAYRGTLDEAVGMIHMKDVVACFARQESPRIRDLLRPVLFVVPSMPASKLLLQMRLTRQHMAMVVDEFGGIDGLVTIEDLVEEIVGEIEDEHDDPATPDVIARPDGTLLIDARMTIEAFESRVGVLLSPEERETIDTLAGYVLHLAGRVPLIGETVAGPGSLIFEVLETDQNRIKRVRVRGLRRAADEAGQAR
jgi:CBS domain containing-hemolysin-like protein